MGDGVQLQAGGAAQIGSRSYFWLVLLALACCATLLELGRMDIISDNEGQRAAPPAEMLRSHDVIVPTLNGTDYLAKPPLLYWAIAGLYRLTGRVSPLIARTPSALCGIGLVLGVYFLVRQRGGEMPARWAACATLASPYVLERARLAQLDVPLTFTVFLTVAAFSAALRAQEQPRRFGLTLAAGVSLGMAILLKGPAPLLFVGAAWLAHMALAGAEPDRTVRSGIQWGLLSLGIQFVLSLLAMALSLLTRNPTVLKAVSLPVGLALVAAAWIALAWRHGPERRARDLGTLAAVVTVGCCVAAPWGIAVLHRKGWPYIQALLQSQVVERTYTASRINSGSPFYYILAMPALLAPWGFLLPLHFTKSEWRREPDVYRFACVLGWASVVLFSLIAGKEYEYVLPAMPFLLIPTGFHLASFGQPLAEKWAETYRRWWCNVVLIILPVAAVGGIIYVSIEQPVFPLLAETWCLCGGVIAFGLWALRSRKARLHLVFFMALCATLTGLLSRAYHYTGDNSPKKLATFTGRLVREGHDVAAAKVAPAFAFYAGTPIPVEIAPGVVVAKLTGEAPYYYVVRERFLDPMLANAPPDVRVLMGPFTSKRLCLVGNAPLPNEPAP